MKKFIYETQKFIYVDPENEEAMYDGYDPSSSTISDKDFEELGRSENYSIQGGHSYVDYIFGKIENEDKGDTIVDTLTSGTQVVYNKIGEVEIEKVKNFNQQGKYTYAKGVKFEGFSCGGKIKGGKLLGGVAKIYDSDDVENVIQDNLGGGVEIFGKSEEETQIMLKRVMTLPFQLCD